MDRCRWGIVGPGNIARKFAEDFRYSVYGELVAVASRSGSRAREFASEFGIARSYESYEAIFADPEVDAIYIATPHNFHFPQSAAALKAGKAVLCEKPLTESLGSSIELLQIAQETGNYLMEGMWTWFLPAIQKALSWYREGRIGAIRHIKADFGFPSNYDPESRLFSPDLAGGSLLDLGIYPLAITHLFIEEEPDSIVVQARKAPTGVDEDVQIIQHYKQAAASLHCSFIQKLPNRAEISGENGRIVLPDFWSANECFFYRDETLVEHYSDNRKSVGFQYEIDAVSRDVLNGKTQSDQVDHKASLRLAKAMDEVVRRF